MKKILLILGVTLFTTLSAQDDNQQIIMNDVKESAALMQSKDPSIYIKQIHPAAYQYMDKEALLDSFMSQTEGTADYKLNILPGNEEEITVSEIFEGKKGHYAIVSQPVNMEMTYFKKFDEKFKTALAESLLAQGMKPDFLGDDTLRLTKNAIIIAINDDKTGGEWKYLTYQPNSELLNVTVDADVLRKAAEQYQTMTIKDDGKATKKVAEPKKQTTRKK